MSEPRVRVALVHDYVTQRGGAERVVLAMAAAFPGAPLYTSLYQPEGAFEGFGGLDIHASMLNRVALLRRHYRLALPLLAPAFNRTQVDADVVICSSSGWGHGAAVTGRKIVYCHTPARCRLYQTDRYVGDADGAALERSAVALLGPHLRRWDAGAARSAHRYLVNSTVVRERVRSLYGIEAEVLPPPPAVTLGAAHAAVEGVEPEYWLCVSRLLPYKNVDVVAAAFSALTGERLVVAGGGPEERRLRQAATPNVTYVGVVGDAQLAWLYENSRGLVAASYEDFGLAPLEANGFGKPVAALSWGGFLDTVEEGVTGCFFATPTPEAIRDAVTEVMASQWSAELIAEHASRFSQDHFVERLRQVVDEELARA